VRRDYSWSVSYVCRLVAQQATEENEKRHCKLRSLNFDVTGCTLVQKRRKYDHSFDSPNGRPSRWALPRILVVLVLMLLVVTLIRKMPKALLIRKYATESYETSYTHS